MRIAYADPPYLGYAGYYSEKQEVDHADLIAQLERDYDGWALSLYSNSLKQILALCPDTVRVGAWVKPFCSFKPGNFPYYGWEPVIYKPARKRRGRHNTVDWVSASMTVKRGMKGAKPEKFCYWLFSVLALDPSDEFIDMFQGSGAVTRAWEQWHRQPPIRPAARARKQDTSLWTA